VFFLFLPIFAALLELLYRREGYYLDHLVFALYFHSVGFLVASGIFLVGKTVVWLPGWMTIPINAGLLIWLIAYLPMALRRVYGGSRAMTALKLVGLAVLYWATYGALGIPLLLFAGLVSI
jgi:hypothetical protein